MTSADPAAPTAVEEDDAARTHRRAELWREATIMVLYVSVVEIAELAALPEAHYGNGVVVGPTDGALLSIVWGTAMSRKP